MKLKNEPNVVLVDCKEKNLRIEKSIGDVLNELSSPIVVKNRNIEYH